MENIIAACITALLGLSGVLFTIYKTRQLRIFEIYFEKKVSAYQNFITAIYAFQDNIESKNALAMSFHQLMLFSSRKARRKLEPLVSELLGLLDSDDVKGEITSVCIDICEILRNDLDSCRRNKFK